MKRILFTVFAICIFKLCLAQSLLLNSETSRYEYSEVIEVDSIHKIDLFERFRAWGMKATVSNQKKSISETDSANLKIIIQISGAPAPVNVARPLLPTEMGYVITAFFKDNRYKVYLTDFNYLYAWGTYGTKSIKKSFEECKPKKQTNLVKKANENISDIINYMKSWINNPSSLESVIDNDW